MDKFFLKTEDNINIAINHIKNKHKEVIILVHGWFMTKDSKAFMNIANDFSKNFDVISFDCRGHGKSTGFYTFTSKETIDLKTVINYAKKYYEKIYLVGFSLGGALVLIHSAINKNVDKVIAVSAPCDFNKIENKIWKKEAWLPTLKKCELKRWLSIRPSLIMRKKIKPIDVIKNIEVPTLFIAGEKDPTVYPWHTELLYEKATCPKSFELFKSIHAEDLYLDYPEKFIETCTNWLKQPSHNSYSQTSEDTSSLSHQ